VGRSVGPYLIEAELGRGAFGRVFRARHRATGAVRALKLLDAANDPDLEERFRREAEALGRAGGAGVVPVHELGFEGGRPYIVMGLMPGGSLRSRLASAGRRA
jgi:serine/threonine-protein kinase